MKRDDYLKKFGIDMPIKYAPRRDDDAPRKLIYQHCGLCEDGEGCGLSYFAQKRGLARHVQLVHNKDIENQTNV